MAWSQGMRSHSNISRTPSTFEGNARAAGPDGRRGLATGNRPPDGHRLALGLQARSSEGPLQPQRGAPAHVAEPYLGAARVKVPPLKLLNKNNFFGPGGQGANDHLSGQKRALEELAQNLGSLQSVDKSGLESWKDSANKQGAPVLDRKNFDAAAADYVDMAQNPSQPT